METILLIEDSVADQFLAEHIIHSVRPNINLKIASDGVEALDILNKLEKHPDLILLDINMPRMDGHGFLKALNQYETIDVPVVIMLTSSNQEKDKQEAMQHKRVKDYFLKPISEDNMLNIESIIA